MEIFSQENFKALTDLLVLGFDDLIGIIEAKHGNAEEMKLKDMETQAEYIYSVFPRIRVCLFKQICRDADSCFKVLFIL